MENKKAIDWHHHIEAQRSSGQPQQDYCKERGLNFHSFSYQVQKSKGEGKRFKKAKQKTFVPVTLRPERNSFDPVYELTIESKSLKMSKGFDVSEVTELMKLMSS